MDASFVILNYNRKAELLTTIANTQKLIASTTGEYEIIVVDNNSSDQSAEAVKSKFPEIKLIERKVNTGIVAWNDGFAAATGRYLIVLDDDSHMESGLTESIAYMDQNPDVGILALNITGGSYETSEWDDLAETIGFIGCGAVIKQELYQKIGGFADWLFVYGHEWEYGLRALDAGYKIRYFKNSSVMHRTSKLNRTSKRLRIFTTRNEMGMVYKHFRSNKFKYLIRVWMNNLKVVKTEGFMSAYYSFLGGLQFWGMRKELEGTPVSPEIQERFANIFWGTQPVFGFVKKRLNKVVGHA